MYGEIYDSIFFSGFILESLVNHFKCLQQYHEVSMLKAFACIDFHVAHFGQ